MPDKCQAVALSRCVTTEWPRANSHFLISETMSTPLTADQSSGSAKRQSRATVFKTLPNIRTMPQSIGQYPWPDSRSSFSQYGRASTIPPYNELLEWWSHTLRQFSCLYLRQSPRVCQVPLPPLRGRLVLVCTLGGLDRNAQALPCRIVFHGSVPGSRAVGLKTNGQQHTHSPLPDIQAKCWSGTLWPKAQSTGHKSGSATQR